MTDTVTRRTTFAYVGGDEHFAVHVWHVDGERVHIDTPGQDDMDPETAEAFARLLVLAAGYAKGIGGGA
jgi:hypothetical protein